VALLWPCTYKHACIGDVGACQSPCERFNFELRRPVLQAISRGITKSSVGVNTYNLETVPLDEVAEAIRKSDGFVIGK